MEVTLSATFITVLLALTQLQNVQSAEVMCREQQEVCMCDKGETECEFTLTVEELQTFTSYEIVDDIELTRGIAGSTYFANSSGYIPTIPPDTPIFGPNRPCSLRDPIVNLEDFLADCSIPMTVDGETFRLFVAVNGRIPSPTLIVDEGALVRVRVQNKLTSEGITIHWHGMHQRDTPWMDGVGFISQAPITPGAYFDYVFKATPAGTHWYHSHVGAQRTDGLFGALVVRETVNTLDDVRAALVMTGSNSYGEIIDLPGEHTLTLFDWQREASLDLFVRINPALCFYYHGDNADSKPIGDVPTRADATSSRFYIPTFGPDSTEVGPIPYWSGLINGRGIHSEFTPAPLSVFQVSANRAYRFRIIGAQSVYAYSFSIDGHKLRVIATDGHFIQPVDVDYLIVHSGERYDFVIETFGKNLQNYWMRATTLEENLGAGVEHSARAILTYGNDTNIDWRNYAALVTSSDHECTPTACCNVLNCPFRNYSPNSGRSCLNFTDLVPLSPIQVSSSPCSNCTLFFNFGFEGASSTSAINGRNFQLPVTPYQTNCGQYNEDKEDCSRCTRDSTNPLDCRCIHVKSIMNSEVFDENTAKIQLMVFSAVGVKKLREFAHPVHLHGHSFHVLHVGYGNYSDTNALVDPSPDVTCNGDISCREPNWTAGMPNEVRTAIRDIKYRILKDTVNVPAGGYVAVAFRADNPGYWFLHCHIEVHQLEGMGVLIEEYSSNHHKAPPKGIDKVGHFRWEISNYRNFIQKGETCKEMNNETCDPGRGNGAATATVVLNVGVIVLSSLIVILAVYY